MLDDRGDARLVTNWCAEVRSRRAVERSVICCPASLMVAGRRYRGEIWDVSPLGALLRLSEVGGLAVGARVLLMPRGHASIPGEVRHIVEDEQMAGIKLMHDSAAQAKMAKWLDYMRPPARTALASARA